VNTGFTVFTAADADLAMNIVDEHPAKIDLLLTDVMLCGQSGAQLAERVLKRAPATKVLFMSGAGDEANPTSGVLENEVDIIEKPFSPDDLVRGVHGAIDGASETQSLLACFLSSDAFDLLPAVALAGRGSQLPLETRWPDIRT
jgi:DNA-binding response OmpR family regulator